jgi:uncharacterized protein YukE
MLETSDWGDGAPSVLSAGGAGASASPSTSLGAGAPSYYLKINEVSPSDVSGMDVNQVMGILHSLDVDGVTEAADAQMNLASKLEQVASRLASNAHTLAGSWQGTAAQAAMDKFQQMHTQTSQLAAQAKQTGQVLHWTASVMQKYKNLPTPQGESATQADEQTGAHIGGAIGGVPGSAIGDAAGAVAGFFGIGGGNQAKANAQAQKYLNALNQHLVAANNALPSTIGQAPEFGNTGLGPAHTGTGGGAVSGPGPIASAPPISPYPGSGVGTRPVTGPAGPTPTGKFHGAPLPNSGPGPSGTLQGYTPPPGNTSTLPPPGPTAPPPAPGPGNMPPGLVPGGPVPNNNNGPGPDEALTEDGPISGDAGGDALAGVDDAVPDAAAANGAIGDGAVSDVAAESGVITGADGEIGAADASAVGAEGEGMGFPMMGGAGSGQQDKERQRQVWMNEDTDIWGVPKDNVGSVIDENS